MSFHEFFDELARPVLDGFLSLWPHAVTVQSRSIVTDAAGETTEVWTAVGSVWNVSIRPQSAGETVRTWEQVVPDRSYLVRGEYRDGITADMRLLFGSKILNIEAVSNLQELGRDLELRCRMAV